MISSSIQNIITTINKDIQKEKNNFVDLCFQSKFKIMVLHNFEFNIKFNIN